jgi:catechol 2,3-dioxygenase-like lactoylglutathione lyase family enzyme
MRPWACSRVVDRRPAGWRPGAAGWAGIPFRRGGVSGSVTDVTEMRVALTVPDFDAALAFYRDALGLAQIADWSSEGGRVVLLEAGRATLELFDEAQADTVDRIEAGRRVSGTVRLALEVADSESAARRLVAAGAEEVAPPVTTPWGDHNARVRAPDGMQLTLFTSG